MPTARVWRVFPWDGSAEAGQVFTPSYVPPLTGRGRFDLTRAQSRVLYVAESAEHAVAEVIHPWSGQTLGTAHLLRAGRPLAVASAEMEVTPERVADLCDPALLSTLDIPPDQIASRRRAVTQPIARTLWDRGYGAVRWWSRFWGDWHTWALFVDRLSPRPAFGPPERLDLTSPSLVDAARLLGIELGDA